MMIGHTHLLQFTPTIMQRDGQTKSLWQEQPDYNAINSWSRESVYDAIIVGGGITGLTTALLLQEAGKKCIVLEAHTPGFGTTSGTTAHLNTMLDTPYHSVESDFGKEGTALLKKGCLEAIQLVERNSIQHNIDSLFSWRDGYLFAQDDKEVKELEDIYEASERAGCVVSWSDTIPVPENFIKAVKFGEQAQFHSTRYLSGLARAFEAAGGVILQHCVVQSIDDGEPVVATTSLGEVRGATLVWATHIPPGVNVLHFRCAPYRSYAAAFRLAEGMYPQGLAYDMKDPYHYYRTQEIDGEQYLIAGGCDHKTGHNENTESSFRELEAHLRHLYTFEGFDYSWSSQYYNSSDGLPYIGHMPGNSERVYCATGYSGNGMTLGSLAGKVLSDMISGKESPYKDLFSPSRIKPIAGFLDFVKENADVVSQFIGKRFSYEKVSSLAELAKGEATLADWDGKKVALYKGEDGKVKAVDPVCPHAKCIVGWNSAEKSWDCPCHGARYAPNGALLNGPARRGLEPVMWEDFEGD